MSTLLRDVIEIPEVVHKGDFVMSLASGVTDKAGTLEHYVVTDQLARAFDNALGFIASAVREDKSKAAYLDGSFGSGKSHFMAVLHLVLQRDPDARGIPELAQAIKDHDETLEPCSFALVPFHMIGAESMEQAIFGGYVEHVRRIDPGAPPPSVYPDEPLLKQADDLRPRMGDEAFFSQLNAGASGEPGGWGKLQDAWTSETYEQGRTAPPGDAQRGRLTGAIIANLLPSFLDAMRGSSTGYVGLDVGLAELARHARDRGHDALILFLDELILWLASRIADPAFVAREGQKLIKLIEFVTPRPIPIVSFVARQRDLREFVGDQIPGAEKLSFADALKHWEDRFHHVELHDRNLPKIAERRLLRPRDEAARQQLDEAFRETERSRKEVLDVLMTADGDRDLFRSTYPFSPAFMKTLVAASSALQRERTALRVMLQLLVGRRDELSVGDLVSVGDLFDVLAQGDEPFTEDMKRNFEQAKTLYRDHFRPLLLEDHGLAEAQLDALERTHPFQADDRLVKTLMLAALVPQTSPLRNLDVAKLAALNHGSIASPIPGDEKRAVLGKLRRWSSQVGALKVGEDPQNPTVTVRLTGVDIESIIDRAQHVDNAGERRRLIKSLVLEELGVEADTRLFSQHTISWRGTPRSVEVVFGNVRDTQDLPDDTLGASNGRWKVVVDYPFDPGHTPLEDLERLDRWRADHGETSTVCWIPAFFSQALQRDLKKLVIISHVLGGERLDQFADHLSQQDRAQAHGLLSDQKSALEQRVRTAIRQAYGVERAAPETVDLSHGIEERIQSLRPGFTAQVPIGATLRAAFDGLVGKLLDHQYPGHPRFESDIKPRDLRVVLEETLRAVDAPDGRIEVASDRRRLMRRIATPLQLGVQHEAPFVLGQHWNDHFDKAIARATQQGQSEITVGDLRRWIDDPDPLGLPPQLQALVIIVYAAQSGRTFRRHGGPAEPSLDKLDDDLELVTAALPDEKNWRIAVDRAASVLGLVAVNPARNPASFEALVVSLREKGAVLLPAMESLLPLLEHRTRELEAEPNISARIATARVAAEVAQTLARTEEAAALIDRLAAMEMPMSEQHVGTSLATAAAIGSALDGDRWQVLELVAGRAAAGERGFAEVAQALRAALLADEFAAPLEPAIAKAYDDGVRLLQPVEPPPPPPPGVVREQRAGLSVDQARNELNRLAAEQGKVVIDLHWSITAEPGDQ
jgi:hypothetical protein